MDFTIEAITMDRYDDLIAFWNATEGIWHSDDDEHENLERFLARNPGLGVVALQGKRIIGTVKCGHDGRRGYLHHLGVASEYRNRGIGRVMVSVCLKNLAKVGISKVRVLVMDTNQDAITFWKRIGFSEREYDYRTLAYDGDD